MHSFSANLIQTKLRPPGSAKLTIKRKQVFEQFFAPPVPTLILVNAPAGYGKTTTMCEWWSRLREREEKVAWLSLDQNDQNAATFLSYLIASLDMAELDMGDLVAAAHSGLVDSPTRVVLSLIINRIIESDSPLFLILDDYHLAASTEVDSLINEMLTYAQGRIHIVIATRIKPELAIADLRLKRGIRELGVHDLRFSREEGLVFVGHETDVSSTLVESSEGWPAALQLARLWLDDQESSGTKGSAPAFTGRSAELAAYLAEQVFSGLPERLQNILVRVSVAEHFNGDLINVLCDCTDGWEMIEQIKDRNIFITSFDDDDRLIFHQLFREFLLDRANYLGSDIVHQLHVTAAMWFCDNGQLNDALVQARKSKSLDCISTILEKSGGWTLAFREGAQNLRMLMSISHDDVLDHPNICLVQMYLHMQFGEISEARTLYEKFAAAQSLSEHSDKEWVQISCNIINNTLKVYEDNPLKSKEIDNLISLSEYTKNNYPSYHNVIQSFICYLNYEEGDFVKCMENGVRAFNGHMSGKSYYAAFFVNCYVALSQYKCGDVESAVETLQNGIRISSDHYSVHSAQVAMANVFLAQIAYENNDLERAGEILDGSFDIVCERGGWFEVLAPGYIIRTMLLLHGGKAEEALDLVQEAMREAQDRDQSRLYDLLLAHQIVLLIRSGDEKKAWAFAQQARFQEIVANADGATARTHPIYMLALRTWADLLADRDKADQGLAILERAIPEADRLGNIQQRIRMRVAAAIIADKMGEQGKALTYFADALEIEAGRGLIRSFLDQGEPVLKLASDCLGNSGVSTPLVSHGARRILAESRKYRSKGAPKTNDAFEPILSSREQEVLELLARGFSSKEMARELNLAEGTIKVHRKRLYRRLQVHSRSGALAIAETKNLLP